MKKASIFNNILTFAALMIFWLAMSGKFSAIYIAYGVFSVLVVLLVDKGLRGYKFYSDEIEDLRRLRFGYAVYYMLWLTWQILVSAVHVAKLIVRRRMPVATYIIKFKTHLPTANERVILGNSITLTPGTLTLDITGDEFTVHALTYESCAGLLDDSMPRHVARLFSREDKAMIYDLRIITSPDKLK